MVVDRGEFFNMLQGQLDAFYRAPEGLQRPGGLAFGPPGARADLEGVAAWAFDVYLNQREQGRTPEQAWDVVAANIRSSDEWRSKHSSGPPQPGDWPSVPTFSRAPREYTGNLGGMWIDGLPPVLGGADPRLFLSWFYDRYTDAGVRAHIRSAYAGDGNRDLMLSWPDARQFGYSPQQFMAFPVELVNNGLRASVALLSDEIDPHHDVAEAVRRVNDIAPGIIASRAVGRVMICWEMSAAFTPEESVELIRAVAPQFVNAGIKCYVHLEPHWFSMVANPPSQFTQQQVFYNEVRGLITGLLAQTDEAWPREKLLDWINDCLERCAGNDNMPMPMIEDPVDGAHGLDFIHWENGTSELFRGARGITPDTLKTRGDWALSAPTRTGPRNGEAHVRGTGNGRH